MLALLTAPTVRLTSSSPADLARSVELAPGVSVDIDLDDPSCWHAVEVRRWAAADRDLLEALIGAGAVREVTGLLAAGATEADVPVDCREAAAWLRVAVVDALDWWLQLPLNQGLLDAERAVARARAAMSLPAGALRDSLVDRALVLARRSAGSVSDYLNGLASLPEALFSRVSWLVDGYAALAEDVDGPDAALAAVQTAWNRVREGVVPAVVARPFDPVMSGFRQLRARVVGDDVQVIPQGEAVRVLVPAFAPAASPVVTDRLMVRIVDRRSGLAQDPVLLTVDSDSPVLTGLVPLRGTPVEHLRVDVFDADSVAASSDVGALRQLRLSSRRRAAAESAVQGGPAADLLVAELAAAID